MHPEVTVHHTLTLEQSCTSSCPVCSRHMNGLMACLYYTGEHKDFAQQKIGVILRKLY